MMALPSQLGLRIDQLLEFKCVNSDDEMTEWNKTRTQMAFGAMADAVCDSKIETSVTLDLFLRLRALEELPGEIKED